MNRIFLFLFLLHTNGSFEFVTHIFVLFCRQQNQVKIACTFSKHKFSYLSQLFRRSRMIIIVVEPECCGLSFLCNFKLLEIQKVNAFHHQGICVCVRDGRNYINGDGVNLLETKKLLKIIGSRENSPRQNQENKQHHYIAIIPIC